MSADAQDHAPAIPIGSTTASGSELVDKSAATGRRVLKTLDSRFVVPDDLDPIRILQTLQVANNDGGTGWHYEFVTLCEEVEVNAPTC